MISQTLNDARYAIRLLAKNPGFACVVILTLALGIGANAAIFSLTDRVLLQSLPVEHPDELVVISSHQLNSPTSIGTSFSYPMYQDLLNKNDVFTGVIARGGTQMNVSYGDQNEHVRGELVSGNFFDVLGVKPWLGRLLTQNDDLTPGGHPVVVLSYQFWERRFGKDMGIVGKTILVNEYPLTVLGVTPPGFYGISLSDNPDVRVPLMMTPVFNPRPATRLKSHRHQWLTLMARRKPSVTTEQAEASIAALYQQLIASEAQQLPANATAFDREQFLQQRISIRPGDQGFQRLQSEMKTSLLLLFGATFAVLLIVCANLANLMMARATVRAQESAVRLALGAGRGRILRQWLTEGVVLSSLGGLVGIFIALWIKAALLTFIPPDVRRNLTASFDWRQYTFILLVSLIVGMVFSAAPAIQAARQTVSPGLGFESRSFTSAGHLLSLRSGLILIQVALSIPLLVSAGLLVRTLQNLRSFDPGFSKDNVLLASLNPTLNGYTPEKSRNLYEQLLVNTRNMSGVAAASLATDSPISGGWDQNSVVVEGYTPRPGEKMGCDVTYISTDYLKTLRVSLVTGRDFNEQDRVGAPKVALVNEKMAHYFFGNANPIGKRIGLQDAPDTTIVGVVRDVTYVNLREGIRRHFYLPTAQESGLTDLVLHVKTNVNPDLVSAQLLNELKQLDPHLPLYNVKTLAREVDDSLIQERLVSWLTSAFGVLAALLTALGLYGVLTFSVARRTREIGIRVALGAQRADVFKLIMRRGMLLVGMGVVIGIGAAIAISRVIAGLLFGITPSSPSTFVIVSAGLLIIAAIASYIPARRATKVDPMVALRYE